MHEREKSKRTALLSRLFAGLEWYSKAAPETVAETYLFALEGIDTDALEKAVEQFIKGNVEDWDGRKVPTTAMLVRQAAKWQTVLHKPVKALPPPEPVISPEERARVAEGFKRHVTKLETEARVRRMDVARRVHGRGHAEAFGDPRPLSERLRLDHLKAAE